MALQTADVLAPMGASTEPISARHRWITNVRKWAFWIPTAVLVLMMLGCFVAPALFGLPGPNVSDLSAVNLPLGSPGHLLGTDPLGNDLLSRTLFGGRISIEVGVGATAIGFLAGSAVGLIAGYLGGGTDSLIMRILDVLLAFPALILALAVAAFLGPNERDEIFAIAFLTVPQYARLARAATLKVRSREFVLATRIMGGKRHHILARHIYPNIFPTLLTVAPLTIAVAMVIEAALSFLGAGIRPPAPSWGNMIAAGQSYLSTAPDNVLIPGLFLFVTVFALNVLGDQIRAKISE